MFNVLRNVLKRRLPKRLSYEDARAVLEAHERDLHKDLAHRADAEPEMLYYLAANGDLATRRAVATNPATPAEANRFLADDVDEDVRVDLARKIGRLLPDLMTSERERVTQLTIETLEQLASDQVTRVRAVLAEEIKGLHCVPKHIIQMMVKDLEATVYVPILEYSPLLSDADLLEIIASARAQAALNAVARRRGLEDSISAAVVATLDIPSIASLLANPNARIREETIEKILDDAKDIVPWHGPLVMRTDLSVRALRRVASFVGSSLLQALSDRHGLDSETQSYLGHMLRERLEKEGLERRSQQEKAVDAVRDALARGALDSSFIEEAVETGNRDLVIEGLSELGTTSRQTVERILSARNAKGVTALAWHCGLTMRTAFKIQTLLLKLPAGELLPARAGVGFPMSPEEMRWHLSFFAIQPKA